MSRVLIELLGMVPAMIAGLTLVVIANQTPQLTVNEIQELFESKVLTLVCIIGASFGGLFNLYFFDIPPETVNPSRARIFQFLVACLLGVCLASPLLHWTHWKLNITWVLLTSAMSATFGIMLIRGLTPTLKELVAMPLEKLKSVWEMIFGGKP